MSDGKKAAAEKEEDERLERIISSFKKVPPREAALRIEDSLRCLEQVQRSDPSMTRSNHARLDTIKIHLLVLIGR